MEGPATQDAMLEATDPGKGVPLTVVRSYTDGAGEEWVVLEDEDGAELELPGEWVKHDYRNNFKLDHLAIDAPPGELERIWREGTYLKEYGYGGIGGEGNGGDIDTEDTASPLDLWKENRLNPSYKPEGFFSTVGWHPDRGRGGVPSSAEKAAHNSEATRAMVSSFLSGVAKPRAHTMHKEDIPADAGAGWGNWDQVWNPRKQRWETPRKR